MNKPEKLKGIPLYLPFRVYNQYDDTNIKLSNRQDFTICRYNHLKFLFSLKKRDILDIKI